MKILVLSDKPDSIVLKRGGIDSTNALPFPRTPFDPDYLEPNTDVPEEIKVFKHRLANSEAVVVHVLPGQKLSSIIAWGKLGGSDWSHLDSATVIREDGDANCEDEMNGRLAEVIDEGIESDEHDEIALTKSVDKIVARLTPSAI